MIQDDAPNVPLRMVRETLEGIPEYALPSGFSTRWYEPGDEISWLQIHREADLLNEITPDLFAQQFGSDASVLAQRQCYIIAERREAVGTGTAWFSKGSDPMVLGRVHWVAVLPGYQGRGLARALMTVLCRRLRELGHRRAYLTTSSARRPAIKLYQLFGFTPWIQNEREQVVWEKLAV